MSGNVVASYSSKQTQQIAGITYRQLDYWARTGLVQPSVASATGSGSRRAYSYSDLLKLRIIKDLLDNGVGLPQIREVFRNHRDILGEDLVGGRLVISGSEVLFMTGPDELVALLQRPGQQALALIMLEVAGIKEQLNGAIVSELGRWRSEELGEASEEGRTAPDAVRASAPEAGYGG
ncbi:MAG: MerR family transcriptional regulator [bacterium]|nr:MerR family transcriptional regulator [bacterium]